MEFQPPFEAFYAGGQLIHVGVLFHDVAVHVGEIAAHSGYDKFKAVDPGFQPGEAFGVIALGGADCSKVFEDKAFNFGGHTGVPVVKAVGCQDGCQAVISIER